MIPSFPALQAAVGFPEYFAESDHYALAVPESTPPPQPTGSGAGDVVNRPSDVGRGGSGGQGEAGGQARSAGGRGEDGNDGVVIAEVLLESDDGYQRGARTEPVSGKVRSGQPRRADE